MLLEDKNNFAVNIYSYFTYIGAGGAVSLDYDLGNSGIDVDGFHFDNVVLAQVAAIRASLLRLDSNFTAVNLPLIVGEAGWPTAGGDGATIENAKTSTATYNRATLSAKTVKTSTEKQNW